LDPTKFSPTDLDMPEYPGTIKGDRPEDDPQFYSMWLEENQSPIMKKISELFSNINSKLNVRKSDSLKSNIEQESDSLGSAIKVDLSDYATMNKSHADLFSDPNYIPNEMKETTEINFDSVNP